MQLGAHRLRALLGKRIAFVPQEPMTALNPVLSVASQFDEHLRRLGVGGRATRRRHAIEMLSAVHLPEPEKLLAKYPHELSGGMCQRVLIAMAFAGDPALVVADEPTTALDVITQARIMALIKEMQALHRTAVVLITHDLRLAAHVCDTVLVMYAGDIVEQGDAKTLLLEPKHPYTRSLQRANPNLTGPRRRLPTLPDHMPGLVEFGQLPGCRFAPRCPVRAEACEQAVPALVALTPGHYVRRDQGPAPGQGRNHDVRLQGLRRSSAGPHRAAGGAAPTHGRDHACAHDHARIALRHHLQPALGRHPEPVEHGLQSRRLIGRGGSGARNRHDRARRWHRRRRLDPHSRLGMRAGRLQAALRPQSAGSRFPARDDPSFRPADPLRRRCRAHAERDVGSASGRSSARSAPAFASPKTWPGSRAGASPSPSTSATRPSIPRSSGTRGTPQTCFAIWDASWRTSRSAGTQVCWMPS